MALNIDATSHGTNTTHQSLGGTTTVSHTCTGSNLALIVSIAMWNNGGTAAGCSGVTYNGTAMTKVTGSGQNSSGGKFYTEQWYLIAPSTGANNIVATVGGACDKLGVAGVSFTGADQTNPIDVNTTASGTGSSVTASLTTTAASEYLVDAACRLSANTATSNSGTSVLNDGAVGAAMAVQYASAASSGSNSMSWTYPAGADEWAYSVLAVKAAAAGTTAHSMMLMGIGA